MEPKYQYVCLKLFSRKRKWYNLFKLCNLLYLDVEDCDVTNMYEVFKEKKIVDTDYLKDDIAKLLILLDPTDLKDLCKIFKSKLMSSRKEDMIQSLLKFCRTQSTLTNLKSTEDLIKEQIKLKMGDCCIKLNGEFEEAFYRTYILGTFTNSTFTNMVDYFKNLLYLNVLFPNYQVEEYLIFYSTGEFIRYARARRCRDELEKYAGNHLETLKICKSMFEELKAIKDVEVFDEDRYKKSPHLTRFTARSVYVSGLTSATKTLATKFPEDVKEWLEYMIENESMYTHRIGDWYFHLTWLYMKYLKPFDYTRAAQLLIEVLQEQQDHLSEIQLYQLSKRGDLLRVTKKYKIDQWYHDKIAKLTPPPIHYYDFPRHEIDAQAIRENQSGRKRDYVICDGDGNKRILGVEELAPTILLEQRLHRRRALRRVPDKSDFYAIFLGHNLHGKTGIFCL
ncbi:hypothetical protein NQ318_011787 [Aromia moschata]|uniref:Fanconi-associated nuclease n=1 Tax=Aromia moschata TaxID=1265417 RepID=A0AAV8Y6R0_9CUCU|nr:hypothetical protein NQ318_011787 [Aromia moschata]